MAIPTYDQMFRPILAPDVRAKCSVIASVADWRAFEQERASRCRMWPIFGSQIGNIGWYDAKSDPGEMKDLASARPLVRNNRLVRLWTDHASANNVIIPNTSPVCSADPKLNPQQDTAPYGE